MALKNTKKTLIQTLTAKGAALDKAAETGRVKADLYAAQAAQAAQRALVAEGQSDAIADAVEILERAGVTV